MGIFNKYLGAESNEQGGWMIPKASTIPLPPVKPEGERKTAAAPAATRELVAAMAAVMAHKGVPPVQEGIPHHVVAAITAAVAAFTDGQGVVTGIAKAEPVAAVEESTRKQRRFGRRGAWGQAGVAANTRPF